jgi:hypothetical protein
VCLQQFLRQLESGLPIVPTAHEQDLSPELIPHWQQEYTGYGEEAFETVIGVAEENNNALLRGNQPT